MLKRVLSLLILVAAFSSCVSGTLVYVNNPAESKYEAMFQDKSIGVEPFEVEFSSSRFAIDLRGVTFSVNGQEVVLQKEFITEVDVDDFGRVGILEINALKKTNANKENIQAGMSDEWISGLLGKTNYKVGFFNGFGEGNSGYLSNVPMEKTPDYQDLFLAPEKATTYFSEVRDLRSESSDGLDYILRGYVDISNEVVELITLDPDNINHFPSDDDPQVGQYYLLFNAYIEWEIVDVKTGEIVVDYREKSADMINTRTSKKVLLPVAKGDDKMFNKFFKTTDLAPFALEEVVDMMPRAYQFMAPYYKVTSMFIVDEE